MVPPDDSPEKEKKIANLEQQLNDLKQGLALVTDYYTELEGIKKQQEAVAGIDTLALPLAEDDLEFEGIWKFHEERLVADPMGSVPREEMFDAFSGYCKNAGRTIVDRDAFEFVLGMMKDPHPVLDRDTWSGCRLKNPD